jgi:hypothetical protein
MATFIFTWNTVRNVERSARLMMGGVAITAAVVGVSFKAGLISTAPDYDRQSWYLVTIHAGFAVTNRVDSEADCRKQENSASVCHSGTAMMNQPLTIGS